MQRLPPGKYVVAVSGGVDSMVLLDMLRRQPGLELVVAHVDHGVRADSKADCDLVQEYSAQHQLLFTSTRLKLGEHPSEAVARAARYDFLQQCSKKIHALGIVLAHHQDDLIETALLAIMRGTGWRGLAPLTQSSFYLRPLLQMQKHQLLGYARAHNVPWREDSTNTDETYTRNYIRHTLVPLLDQKSDTWRETFLQHIRNQQEVRQKLENELEKWLDNHAHFYNTAVSLHRYNIIMLPRVAAYEIMQQWMRRITGNSLERPLAETAVLFTKTAKPHKLLQLNSRWQLRATPATVIVEPHTPMISLE